MNAYIDLACYESKTKLFVSSEVPIYQIFADDQAGKGNVSDHMRSVMDDLVCFTSSTYQANVNRVAFRVFQQTLSALRQCSAAKRRSSPLRAVALV